MPFSAASATLSLSSSSSLFLCSPKSLPLCGSIPVSISSRPPRPLKTLPALVVRSKLATLPILSFSGDKVGEASLDLKTAPPDTARSVVHRGLIAEKQNQRRGTASTLTRGEVRGGGKKPYRQKKTGRARRGSQRTPLRPGGGVIFGPKPKDWSIKINRKEKRLALSTALVSAATGADAFVIEDFEEEFAGGPKTKEFVSAMRRWGLDPKEKAMFLMTEVADNVELSCRNIGTLRMLTPRTLNLFDILDSKKLVFTRSAVDYLNSMYGIGIADEDGEEDAVEQEVDEEDDGDES